MDIAIVKQRLFAAHGDTVTIDETTYKGPKKKARFVDKDYGEWKAFVYSICKGARHKQRYLDARKKPIDHFVAKVVAKHGDAVTIKSWPPVKGRCTFVDKEFGEFESLRLTLEM